MTSSQADQPPWLLIGILILVGFPIGFALIWSFVCLLLSAVGGWMRLAKRFSAQQPPAGQTFSSQTGWVGVVRYRCILTVQTSPAGLQLAVWPFFRVGHPPLFIPWHEMHRITSAASVFGEYVVLEIGAPKIARLRLPRMIFVGQPVLIDGQAVARTA